MFQIKEMCEMIKTDTERLLDLPEYEVLHFHALEGRKFLQNFLSQNYISILHAACCTLRFLRGKDLRILKGLTTREYIYHICAINSIKTHRSYFDGENATCNALIVLVITYLTLPTALIINNILNNVTQNRYQLYPSTYYFVDDEDLYYTRILHSYLASLLIVYIFYSLDTLYITFAQHACAMFAVVGYRLKTIHVLNVAALKKEVDPGKYEKLLTHEQERMYEKLLMCVREHQRALQCISIVQSAFSTALCIQIMINIVLLSISGVTALLRLVQALRRLTDAARLVTWMMGDHLHLFFLYLPGQRMLDYSMQVYFDAMECQWHNCFKKSRVVYQILIMRSLFPFKFTALKVAPLNMEAFLSVTQAAVSYFTVLCSTL